MDLVMGQEKFANVFRSVAHPSAPPAFLLRKARSRSLRSSEALVKGRDSTSSDMLVSV